MKSESKPDRHSVRSAEAGYFGTDETSQYKPRRMTMDYDQWKLSYPSDYDYEESDEDETEALEDTESRKTDEAYTAWKEQIDEN